MGLLRQFINWLESGEKTEAEVLNICLSRIREKDSQIRAWVEAAPQPGTKNGALQGIPFGAKDIFETENLATEFGSPVYAGRRGSCDAALVRLLKDRGAVLLGKTHTTAFAYFDPAPTRNPRNLEHTPGGSSSGSAAAVAAGMVPFALGSQTQGSVLRPASFCGVTGFKPTFGTLPLEGVLPFAPSLDTAGLFTETAGDMRLLWERMGFTNEQTGKPEPQIKANERGSTSAVRFGRPEALPDVAPEMKQAFDATVNALRARGFSIETLDLPPDFAGLLPAARLINDYEGARAHEERWKQHGDRIGRKLAELVQRGLRIPQEEYQAALETVGRARHQMSKVFEEVFVILTPAATGPAPRGLESTGDPRMNSPWTALGVPAISIPMPVGSGLPLGLQMTAAHGRDSLLLSAAAEMERQIGTIDEPSAAEPQLKHSHR